MSLLQSLQMLEEHRGNRLQRAVRLTRSPLIASPIAVGQGSGISGIDGP